MKRVWLSLVTGLLLVSAGLPALAGRPAPRLINVHPRTDGPKQRLYIEAVGADEARILAFRRGLMERGAENVNLFLPALIVCDVPAGADPNGLIDDPAFRLAAQTRPGAEAAAASPGPEVQFAQGCYELAARLASGAVPQLEAGDFDDLVFTVPKEIVDETRRMARAEGSPDATAERTIQQNSELMIGDQLVQVIYPESNGNAENWTDQELADASQGVVAGMLAFQQRFDHVPMDFIFRFIQRAQTSYEPIHHNWDTDAEWILDVMMGPDIGMTDVREAAGAVHKFNNLARKQYGTDWAYTAFVADSRNEPGNRFRGAGYTAYAFLGGPYLVQPFPSGDRDPNLLGEVLLFSQIFQHETVHVYWGLDEYPSAPSDCNSLSGYLRYQNKNKQSLSPDGQLAGCPNYVPCLMWGARNDEDRPICAYTEGQIGVIDANPQNNIPDAFDMPPIVEFENTAVETVRTREVTVNFKAISQAVPNINPAQAPEDRISYAPRLKDATLRVNGLDPILLVPVDGRWDETEEDLSFRLSGLSPGVTRIEVRPRNVFGSPSPGVPGMVKELVFVAVEFGFFSFDVREDLIGVSWNTIGFELDVDLELYRVHSVSGRRDTTLLAAFPEVPNPQSKLHPYSYIDYDIQPGETYRYYVTGVIRLDINGSEEEFEAKSNVFDVDTALPTKPGEIVSLVSPNPFRESTLLSIRVPPSGNASTDVAVTIYDVLGRRVKDVFRGPLFSRVELFEWDGTNAKNERVPSGIYFIRASAGAVTEVKKVAVVR